MPVRGNTGESYKDKKQNAERSDNIARIHKHLTRRNPPQYDSDEWLSSRSTSLNATGSLALPASRPNSAEIAFGFCREE
jgi:hypothetical protein